MCVFSLKFLSQNYNTLKGETHRHEKAVPCPRGFLAISARAGGAVRLQQKAASLPSALHTIGLITSKKSATQNFLKWLILRVRKVKGKLHLRIALLMHA